MSKTFYFPVKGFSREHRLERTIMGTFLDQKSANADKKSITFYHSEI